MKRLRLTVAYCGTPWRGWQSLSGGRTVQDELNASIRKSTGIITHVHGSGRTDAGVHALAQVAHVDVPETVSMTPDAWVSAMNACLPLTIRVTRAEAAGRVAELRERFEAEFVAVAARHGFAAVVVGRDAERAAHIATVAVRGCDRQTLVMACDLAGICLATGTACASGSSDPSPAVAALDLPDWVARSAVRASLGATTTPADVATAMHRLDAVFRGLAEAGLLAAPGPG
jgi:selenocysteine lyase/cysteine desulfurase